MQQAIKDPVQIDPQCQEIKNMRKTYAEVLKEEGELKARREMLLRAIRLRLKEPPPKSSPRSMAVRTSPS